MDGNGRWAKKRMMPRSYGHRKGVETTRLAVEYFAHAGVSHLTLFAFSSENWKRPRTEVSLLMELFMTALGSELRELDRNGVRLRFIGERKDIPAKVQRAMENAETQTASNEALTLVIAFSYGGQWDIKQAVQQIAHRIEDGELTAEQITEQHIADNLSTVELLPPDLFIRTGGEHRISNFLLWQLAYTELYFTDTLWPDFNDDAFNLALEDYASRQRRYGMTSGQIQDKQASHA